MRTTSSVSCTTVFVDGQYVARKEKLLSAFSCTCCIDCRRGSLPCQSISVGRSSSSSCSLRGTGIVATRSPNTRPSIVSTQRGARSGLTSMPVAIGRLAPRPTCARVIAAVPTFATPCAAHVVSVFALSAVPLRNANAGNVSVQARRRYVALPASMDCTTPVVQVAQLHAVAKVGRARRSCTRSSAPCRRTRTRRRCRC